MVYTRFIVVPLLFNNVYQGDTRLCRAEIVLVVVALELSAGGALVLVVVGVDVAQPDSRFEVPAFAQKPRVAIREAEARRPTLVTVILGGFTLERDSHAADVVESVPAVQSEKVAIKTFAQPVPELRHDQPVLDLLVTVFIQRPRVVASRDVEGCTFTQTEFHAQIGRGTTKNHSKKMKTSEFQRIQRFSFCFNCAKHADLGISIVPNSWLFFEPLKKATI